MKALVLKEYNRLVLEDVPVPEIGPGDVLIQVRACGICGSDVHGMDGSTGRRKPPIIMGHEAAGVIARTGADAKGWKPGDRVTFDSNICCGECFFCSRGQINLCENLKVLGVSCDEYRQDGAFAEYVAVPQRALYRLPEGLSFERAALAEPVSIATHAVGRASPSSGDTAVVVGAGMVGLLVVQVLRAVGVSVIAVDVDKGRLDLAMRLGAVAGLDPSRCDVRKEVLKRTDGRGADISFEVVGIIPAVNTAVAVLRKGGALVLVGNLSPTVDLPLQAVVTREISIRGSYMSRGEYPAGLDAIARGAINVDAVISATAPLADGPGWFKRLYDREPGLLKVVLVP